MLEREGGAVASLALTDLDARVSKEREDPLLHAALGETEFEEWGIGQRVICLCHLFLLRGPFL
jgi:hypothetical protein